MKMATIDHFAELSQMALVHLGVCCRCGRPLTSEKYLLEGIGRRCKKNYEKLMIEECENNPCEE